MATSSNPGGPAPTPAPQPQPAPAPTPAPPQPQPPTPAPTDAELKERTDKEIAERVASPPIPPTPTQEEADAIKTGEYDASAPAGQRVKRAMESETQTGRYPTR